ncbi:ubiquinol oxidase subunit II [Novosphingobium sp. G106]|uniref:ubiquinol oxidase subunit II n=1 Tax=Novosphingobium sp. G106 TaxID=2849500 RepID=UPI001C2D0F27|nr:ubiquinol oxidase subunit II [Novosphingobium sp. G106]MBV1692005.1 ubiquinol oxidase subunit II [Novosphingobium sp. G106]
MLDALARFRRRIPLLLSLTGFPLLTGCNMVVLDPAGDVAQQQGNLVVIATALMLLIIVPVMALTILFAWRYRAANREARYEPDWDHSTQLELVIWAAPLLIIICLGAITWVGTHLLDPYRALARTAPGKVVAAEVKPLDVQVVALDWKWLFIYPEQGVATVNELALPIDRPVRFRISASSVMNSFYIPALAGQIYAMPGMETKLHAVLNRPGSYEGFSANYSGAGFSQMRFKVTGMDEAAFAAWAKGAKSAGGTLDRAGYLVLEKPSENEPTRRFGEVEAGLFDAVVNMCVEPGKMCMRDMMRIDGQGGMGLAGIHNIRPLAYDKLTARGSSLPAELLPTRQMVAATCLPEDGDGAGAALSRPVDSAPLIGAGLARPGVSSSLSRPSLSQIAVSDAAPFVTGNP